MITPPRAIRRTLVGGVLLVVLAVAVVTSSLLPVPAASAAITDTSAERIGGSDRYETSVLVARKYLAEIADNPDRPETRAAIVVSAEDRHAALAMTAAGLASAFDAPILLTPSDHLHYRVTDFIESNRIELVLVVGSSGVVSASVERELAAVTQSVRRIWGATTAATSVAVAAYVGPAAGSAGTWASRGQTALLANSETIADALVSGPLSYHSALPLLLTPAGALDADVSRYLDRSDLEHVVILGGTAAVSSSVELAIRAKGIGTSRLAGANRYETAAKVAEQLLKSGRPDPCFDGATLGLAVGDRAADAPSSGPLLGERCAPLLLTESNAVPAALDGLLTGDVGLGGAAGRLKVVVFGGEAAVSERTVVSVRDRALRGEPFTATVAATAGSRVFTITFNVDVKEDAATNPNLYKVNDLALGSTDTPTARGYETITLSGRRVTVELDNPLKVGDTITVIGETNTPEGRSLIAVDDTLPALKSVFYRVPRPSAVPDRQGPAVQVVAVAGESLFTVAVSELQLRADDRLRNDVVLRGETVHDLTVHDSDGEAKTVTFVKNSDTRSCMTRETPGPYTGLPPSQQNHVGEACREDRATIGANLRYTASVNPALEPGDLITVAPRALYDQQGNPSRLTRYIVREHADNGGKGNFTVTHASVGTVRHAAQAKLLILNKLGSAVRENGKCLQIQARSNGVAAGAEGNGWKLYPYADPSRPEPAESVIDIGVDPVHRVISYTIVDGKITLANLAKALNANRNFSSQFTARVISSASSACTANIVDAQAQEFSGGRSEVGLRMQFTDYVEKVSFDASDTKKGQFFAPDLLASVFIAECAGMKTRECVGDADSIAATGVEVRVAVRCQKRGQTVYLEYSTSDAAGLPQPGAPIWMPANVAVNYDDKPSTPAEVFNLRSDPEIPSSFNTRLTPAETRALRCEGTL